MSRFVIGIDEVGRGALAGPVVVAAAAIAIAFRPQKLKDSKKLSAKQRELWYAHFRQHPRIIFAVARVYPRQIEKQNISRAANLAAFRAYSRLMKNMHSPAHKIFLDGGLFLATRRWQEANVRNAETLIKADEAIAAVKVASIVAKVHRDKFMKKLAKKHPEYGLEIHKGYGTKMHRDAIKKHGPSEIHRKNFLSGVI